VYDRSDTREEEERNLGYVRAGDTKMEGVDGKWQRLVPFRPV
jgi:hypothetical protein